MRYLVVGDAHCKKEVLKTAEKIKNWDIMIYLGDSCDNWGCNINDNIKAIQQLIDMKHKYGGRFVWLIGNHDYGYYDHSVNMSGHIKAGEDNVGRLLLEHKNLWQVAARFDDILYSHAGFCQSFVNEMYTGGPHAGEDGLVKRTNALASYPGGRNPLNWVGVYCGGNSLSPSPIWARPEEIIDKPLMENERPVVQVVGHTPVPTITRKSGFLTICDTWSQHPDGTPIGDQSFLIIETGPDAPVFKKYNSKTFEEEESWT